MLIKFDKTTALSKNGNEFLRGIIASGQLTGNRCIVWEGEELFECLPGAIVEAMADVRDYVAVTDEKTGTTYESFTLADIDVTKTLEGSEAYALRDQITEAQSAALIKRGPRQVGRPASIAAFTAEQGQVTGTAALMS